ncbi:polyprenyl synthetase family protein [Limosilactobacillus sp. STM2_1]|uniref:Farnesyl diphosphate synthase n=1 Tax=Limosilactobacillus rudii TaxID=2759755 RepID=A0A7W3UJB6_9LACO|nr:farnesyl diphosphate synthase [Limosilactobacillus rudii]MBB1080158.1 polyprenyl synthetase family protein [Limosilactobacillus rudii]MBB1096673.1 polyprenyl synthetase family protein [Limosilactobacillus rudii]MCD7133646.1 polyprenyl synthetase family protein [Limosilactobacillus rudii]
MVTSLSALKKQIDDYLAQTLAMDVDQPILYNSMQYSLMAGGKRLRPALTLATVEMLDGKINDDVLRAATSLELLHTYSLIHDDLPAMDNDDLRRGKPTNHCKFGAGMATLAGDGLLTLAFQWLTDNHLPATVKSKLVLALSKAAGPAGMVAGQARDIEGEHQHLDLKQLRYLHRQKTGALLKYAVLAGGIITNQPDEICQHLASFGANFGLAFQIYDDLMDVLSTTEKMGKKVHKDAGEQKNTYPGLLGIEGAKKQLQCAVDTAIKDQQQLEQATGKSFAGYNQFLAYFK